MAVLPRYCLPNGATMRCSGAALMDSLLCADNGFKRVQQYLSEAQRMLKPGGVLIVISFAPPESRMPFLKARGLEWSIEHSEIGA